jgi:thiosulfate reductase cytochrome b subunit
MNFELINSIACGLIALWATWCVLSGKVKDGILGKVIYAAIAISGFVVMARNQTLFFGPTNAGLTLHVSLALAGIRHVFMVTWWLTVKVWLCRMLNCEHCMGCPKAPEGIERRKS